MTTQMIVRVDSELKAKVNSFAKIEGKNVSEVVRELMEAYVKDRDIEAYVDQLWARTGRKLAAKGFGSGDVERVIREARAQK